MPALDSIFVYLCPGPPEYNAGEILEYISSIYPKAYIQKREYFFSFLFNENSCLDITAVAEKLAACRAHKLNEEVKASFPLPLEIDYERKRITSSRHLRGAVYDGFCLQRVYSSLIDPREQSLRFCHIIFSNQMIGTFDENNKQYHLRVGIYGFPNIISTPGPLEALAKPREYYLRKQMGDDPLSLKKEFKDDILDYSDCRLTELMKGYCAQALFYHLTGEMFCPDRNCRLYNAHWQKDAIWSQIESGQELCHRHSQMASQWGKNRKGV